MLELQSYNIPDTHPLFTSSQTGSGTPLQLLSPASSYACSIRLSRTTHLRTARLSGTHASRSRNPSPSKATVETSWQGGTTSRSMLFNGYSFFACLIPRLLVQEELVAVEVFKHHVP